MEDVERRGTRSKPKAFVRRAYTSGNGQHASVASCGRSTETGMRMNDGYSAPKTWATVSFFSPFPFRLL
jgi:hypothetical protein